MASRRTGSNIPPLVVVVGPTASGKSALGLELARRFNGEIIAADARTLYKGMDIGTAKPTMSDRAEIPHHLLDVTTPDKPITVADFQRLANEAIEDISKRGRLAIMVGGSGLYIDAVLFDFQFLGPADRRLREELMDLPVEELQRRVLAKGLVLPQNARNPRHLMRAIETDGAMQRQTQLRPRTLILGLNPNRETLRGRIAERIESMMVAGLIDEVTYLARHYGWDIEAMRAPAYKAFRPYVEGVISLEEAKVQFLRNDVQLAKRQRTWFKRNNSIHWLTNRDKIAASVDLVTTILNK